MDNHDDLYSDSEDDSEENDDLEYACNEIYNGSKSLTELNLSGQCISQAGMQRLADSCHLRRPGKVSERKVTRTTNLRCLRLTLNDLRPSAAHDLVRLIAASPRLRVLYLNYNYLSNEGTGPVANACFAQMQICDLEGNAIGVEGAQSLAVNLKDTRCTITKLNLNHNHLKDDGVKEIAEALKENTTVKFLGLEFNGITERGLLVLDDVLRKGENLTMETLLLYEAPDYQCVPPRFPEHEVHTAKVEFGQRQCPCNRCPIHSQILYFLALNSAGRRFFSKMEIPMGLWPTILKRLSLHNPAFLYTAVRERPDIVMQRR